MAREQRRPAASRTTDLDKGPDPTRQRSGRGARAWARGPSLSQGQGELIFLRGGPGVRAFERCRAAGMVHCRWEGESHDCICPARRRRSASLSRHAPRLMPPSKPPSSAAQVSTSCARTRAAVRLLARAARVVGPGPEVKARRAGLGCRDVAGSSSAAIVGCGQPAARSSARIRGWPSISGSSTISTSSRPTMRASRRRPSAGKPQ